MPVWSVGHLCSLLRAWIIHYNHLYHSCQRDAIDFLQQRPLDSARRWARPRRRAGARLQEHHQPAAASRRPRPRNIPISGILHSDDTDVFAQALSSLGFRLSFSDDGDECLIEGSGGRIPAQSARVWCGSAGTASRFLAAAAAAGHGRYVFDATPQMRRRPMTPLIDALVSQGAAIRRSS